jgi:hypothetical protein
MGVLVSDNLKPSAQSAKAAKTAGAILGQLRQTETTFISLDKQYVMTHRNWPARHGIHAGTSSVYVKTSKWSQDWLVMCTRRDHGSRV